MATLEVYDANGTPWATSGQDIWSFVVWRGTSSLLTVLQTPTAAGSIVEVIEPGSAGTIPARVRVTITPTDLQALPACVVKARFEVRQSDGKVYSPMHGDLRVVFVPNG